MEYGIDVKRLKEQSTCLLAWEGRNSPFSYHLTNQSEEERQNQNEDLDKISGCKMLKNYKMYRAHICLWDDVPAQCANMIDEACKQNYMRLLINNSAKPGDSALANPGQYRNHDKEIIT